MVALFWQLFTVFDSAFPNNSSEILVSTIKAACLFLLIKENTTMPRQVITDLCVGFLLPLITPENLETQKNVYISGVR